MVTRKDVETQFIRWNMTGTGGERLTAGNWRFRKHVLYYSETPWKRFVRDAKGTPQLLVRENPEWPIGAKPTEHTNKSILYYSWDVPTIGVLSRFDGDELSEPELHERQRFLMLAELRAILDEQIAMMSAADLAGSRGSSFILARVDKMYARYHNYSMIFNLGWPEMPKMYRQEIVDAMKAKVARYHDPKNVAARERAHARKIAKKAFGLA